MIIVTHSCRPQHLFALFYWFYYIWKGHSARNILFISQWHYNKNKACIMMFSSNQINLNRSYLINKSIHIHACIHQWNIDCMQIMLIMSTYGYHSWPARTSKNRSTFSSFPFNHEHTNQAVKSGLILYCGLPDHYTCWLVMQVVFFK